MILSPYIRLQPQVNIEETRPEKTHNSAKGKSFGLGSCNKLQLPNKYKINNKSTQQNNTIPVTNYWYKNLQLPQYVTISPATKLS